ncbi:MAG: hypothetical protein R2865_16265 [Deinococcales bacterium]
MQTYLDVSQENGKALMMRGIKGEVIMLNLLRFRQQADYSDCPELIPTESTQQLMSGRAAYDLYVAHTLPHLAAAGSEVLLSAKGGQFLIEPE